MYDPKSDGVDHYNLYSKAHTRMGRLASNLSPIQVEHSKYGWFATVEGFWFWLSTGKCHNELRVLNGYQSRKFGRAQDRMEMDASEFQRDIKEVIVSKLINSPVLQELLMDTGSVPLVHYYYYGKNDNFKVIVPEGHQWQMEFWQQCRSALQNGMHPVHLHSLIN